MKAVTYHRIHMHIVNLSGEIDKARFSEDRRGVVPPGKEFHDLICQVELVGDVLKSILSTESPYPHLQESKLEDEIDSAILTARDWNASQD